MLVARQALLSLCFSSALPDYLFGGNKLAFLHENFTEI